MARATTLPARRAATRRRLAGSPQDAPSFRAPLTHSRIVDAALELIEQDGLAGFSMRGVAAALGCEPMSIYHYFPSKTHLQDALVDHALAEFPIESGPADPIERLRRLMQAYRALAHRHPKLFPLLATHRLDTPTGVRIIDDVLGAVLAAMPDNRRAAQFFRVLSYYVTGAALDETAGYAKGPSAAEPVTDVYIAEHCPHLAAAAPWFKSEWWDSTFELGLESLLASLRAASLAAPLIPAALAPKPVIRPKR
jgi:AcrR family transcriptional regulator